MQRWLRVTIGTLAGCVAVVVLAAVALFVSQPTHFRVARTRSVAAPASAVLAQLTDIRAFHTWGPWPAGTGGLSTVTFSPSSFGPGAWIDRRDGSSSALTTIVSTSPERVEMRHETMGAFGGAVSAQVFELRALGPQQTEVTWALSSDLSGLARALWPFLDVPGHLEPEMDAALARLEAAALN